MSEDKGTRYRDLEARMDAHHAAVDAEDRMTPPKEILPLSPFRVVFTLEDGTTEEYLTKTEYPEQAQREAEEWLYDDLADQRGATIHARTITVYDADGAEVLYWHTGAVVAVNRKDAAA